VSTDSVSSIPPVSSRRTFWQRRVRDPIVAQLTQGITPEKIALTVAVGSALGLFPILGTTTLLCFLVGLALRLNQPIIQLINQALWPVHIPVIFWCVRLGERLFGAPPVNLRLMGRLLHQHPEAFFQQFGATAVHAIVAWVIIAPFYVTAIYAIALPVMRNIQRVKVEAIAANPPDHPVP
jgi:uncharacterized protein (DUF2062 family)